MSIYFHCNTISLSKLNCRAAIIWAIHSIPIRYIQIASRSTHFLAMNQIMRTLTIRIAKAIIWPIIIAPRSMIMVKSITMFISDTSETKNKTICKCWPPLPFRIQKKKPNVIYSAILDRKKLNIGWKESVDKSTVRSKIIRFSNNRRHTKINRIILFRVNVINGNKENILNRSS